MSREEFIKETKKKLCDKFDYLLAEADAEYISNFLWNEGYRMEEKWISTTEMLPEEDKSLPCFKFGDIRIITVLAVCNKLVRHKNRIFDGENWIWSQESNYCEEVTHWMPFPKSPIKEEERK